MNLKNYESYEVDSNKAVKRERERDSAWDFWGKVLVGVKAVGEKKKEKKEAGGMREKAKEAEFKKCLLCVVLSGWDLQSLIYSQKCR